MRQPSTIQNPTVPAECMRREARMPCAKTAISAHLDLNAAPVAGEIVEVSKTGAKLHMDRPLEVGSFVTVELKSMSLFGEVRHCQTRFADAYAVGLRSHDVSDPKPQTATTSR